MACWWQTRGRAGSADARTAAPRRVRPAGPPCVRPWLRVSPATGYAITQSAAQDQFGRRGDVQTPRSPCRLRSRSRGCSLVASLLVWRRRFALALAPMLVLVAVLAAACSVWRARLGLNSRSGSFSCFLLVAFLVKSNWIGFSGAFYHKRSPLYFYELAGFRLLPCTFRFLFIFLFGTTK